ncbi:MAG: hypothetical protein RL021_981 [Bacteroidota bacterium]|jgi:hypothetical protein
MNSIPRLLVAGFLLLAYGCDKVGYPYVTPGNAEVDSLDENTIIVNGDTFTFGQDNSAVVRKVLLEDYTGHTCGNCPAAGQYISNTLAPANGEQLVAIAVHAGDFALPTTSQPNQPAGSFQTDFRCQTSNAWNVKFGVNFNPCGMVDRVGFTDGSHLLPYLVWSSMINTQKQQVADQRIRILAHHDSTTGLVRIAVKTEAVRAFNRNLKLQVVVTEDSVVDWQTWYGHIPEYEPNYVHRHVLRGAANGDFGVNVFQGATPVGSKSIKGCEFQLQPYMDPHHCSVVAFLFDADTEEVVQTEELHITE